MQARQRAAKKEVVIRLQQIVFVIDHHPVRSIKGCFAPFSLLSRPPLLGEEGNKSLWLSK
jgi:hypothetical protein